MHKKLVKYGNSSALILDRAILALLNIQEGSVVKLSTDGKSLIITPEEPAKLMHQDVHMTGMEMLSAIGQEQMAAIEADPVKKKEYDKLKPGGELYPKLMEAIMPISMKYQADMAKLTSEAFLLEVDTLAAKHRGDRSSAAFVEEFTALRNKLVPNLALMDQEMKEAMQKYGIPTLAEGFTKTVETAGNTEAETLTLSQPA